MPRTTLDFEYNGKEYSLAYTVNIVKRLDREGLLSKIIKGECLFTPTEDLFLAAFEANHSSVPHSTRLKIYEEFSATSEDGSLGEVLLDMIREVMESVAPKGNVKWKVNRN